LHINYTADGKKSLVTGSLKVETRGPDETMQVQPPLNGIHTTRAQDVDGLVAEIDSMLHELDGKCLRQPYRHGCGFLKPEPPLRFAQRQTAI
jgi:hypothetical protein